MRKPKLTVVQNPSANGDDQARNPYSENVASVLNEQACIIYQALAVLRMTSQTLFEEATDNDTCNTCSMAVDAAIALLEPIALLIDDPPAMRQSIDRLEIKQRQAAEVDHG